MLEAAAVTVNETFSRARNLRRGTAIFDLFYRLSSSRVGEIDNKKERSISC